MGTHRPTDQFSQTRPQTGHRLEQVKLSSLSEFDVDREVELGELVGGNPGPGRGYLVLLYLLSQLAFRRTLSLLNEGDDYLRTVVYRWRPHSDDYF